MNIRNKLTLMFLAIAIVPMGVIGLLGYKNATEALRETTIAGLRAVAEFKKSEVLLYFEKLKTSTVDFASDGYIRNALAEVGDARGGAAALAQDLAEHLLRNKLPLNTDLAAIDVLDLNGRIVASTLAGRAGRDESDNPAFRNGLQGLSVTEGAPFAEHVLALDVATPVTSRGGSQQLLGVLVNHIRATQINEILTDRQAAQSGRARGLGKSGEYFLVNRERLMITDSLFVENAAFRQRVADAAVDAGLDEGREMSGIWTDYRGVPVVAATVTVKLGGVDWVLVAKQDAAEAFAHIRGLERRSLAAGAVLLALVVAAALYVTRKISLPIKKLTDSIAAITRGKLDARVEGIRNSDEIGFLASAFNEMSANLLKASTRLESKNRQLEELSIKDGLTGIYNHRHLKHLLTYEFNRAMRYHAPLCCVLIDIDYFKNVNDTHGHLFGDYVLQQLALWLLELTRKTDIVGRYGGEEFMIIFPHTSLEQAARVATKIRETVAARTFSHKGECCNLTVSIGVAAIAAEMVDCNDLIERTDRALYTAKELGRNRVHLAGERPSDGGAPKARSA